MERQSMKILIIAPEVTPFAKSGGLADVAGSLPWALKKRGHDVRIVMPYYRSIAESEFSAPRSGRRMTVLVEERPCEGYLRTLDHGGIPVHFIDNPFFFDRPGFYGDAAGDYPDNAARFGFFCRAVLHMLRGLDWRPEILHLNDWQTALIPVLLKNELKEEPFYSAMASVMTIHNLGYQGNFPPTVLKTLGLSRALYTIDGLEFYHQVSLLKGGVLFADLLTTVSETYCREIQTPAMGHGFDGILRSRREKLFGVINGLDTELWNPSGDPALPQPYSVDSLAGKAADKAALQEELGLDIEPGIPLLAVISRLDRQKGMDLILETWEELMLRNVQFVLLGTGDPKLMRDFSLCGKDHARQASINLEFDEALSRRIYAGADMLLVPSRYEPCGLAQLIALQYGTIPVVRRTGGLADTVTDAALDPEKGNGFTFDRLSGENMLDAVDRALGLYRDEARWRDIMRRGMNADHSWDRSAIDYERLYGIALENRREQDEQGTAAGGTGSGDREIPFPGTR